MIDSVKHIYVQVLMLAAALAFIFVVFQLLNFDVITTYVARAGIWGPIVLIAAKASTIIIAPLGGSLLYPTAGALFGFWQGFTYLVIGDAIGGIVSFWLSRTLGKRVVDYFFHDNKQIDLILSTLGSIKGLLVARIGFILFPEIISYTAGLTKIPFIPFMIIYSGVGLLPTAVSTGLGALITQENHSAVFAVALAGGSVLGVVSMYLFLRLMKKKALADTPEKKQG